MRLCFSSGRSLNGIKVHVPRKQLFAKPIALGCTGLLPLTRKGIRLVKLRKDA